MPTATIKSKCILPVVIKAIIVSFEKHDQKTWYTIQVEPEQGKRYRITKRYEEFIQFSQKIHDQFNKYSTHLPPKIKYKLHLLVTNKQIHAQRAEELNQFLCALFLSTTFITQSFIVREFFQEVPVDRHTAGLWKRFRSTSFLSQQQPLSSFCTQAASKLWHRHHQPEPSNSTPTRILKKSQSSLVKDTIKIKVIYDADNIIVIQVPRSIGLVELRARILQKFSDSVTCIESDVMLLFHENSSTSSSHQLIQEKALLPATLITKEKDLISLMSTKWSQLDKITLHCVM
ncbi:hypothetical protein G6F43_010424 [Rhizopus delemar]|nr:hypothetical protein G6F43_010424 [Rhizopus delemar]